MSGRLTGKVCVITGTGGSMGRAAAMTFAREGASVVGCDLNVDAAEATMAIVRKAGGTMVSVQPCRLTKPAECQALVDLAVRTYGRIDVLFNNAAMAYFNWLEDITDEEWSRDLREEIDLVFFLTRAAGSIPIRTISSSLPRSGRGAETMDRCSQRGRTTSGYRRGTAH